MSLECVCLVGVGWGARALPQRVRWDGGWRSLSEGFPSLPWRGHCPAWRGRGRGLRRALAWRGRGRGLRRAPGWAPRMVGRGRSGSGRCGDPPWRWTARWVSSGSGWSVHGRASAGAQSLPDGWNSGDTTPGRLFMSQQRFTPTLHLRKKQITLQEK